MTSKKKAVVLGAGFAGLWISRRLLDEGFEVELLEAASRPGGLMETIVREGFVFDLGPHILLSSHLEHYSKILKDDLLTVRGFYGFGYQGKQILSPLTPGNLFRTLGPGKAVPFAASMAWHRLPFVPPRPPWNNVDEVITSRFGKRVNAALFRDYIPKITGLPSTEVSTEWFLERHRFYREHSLARQMVKKAVQPMRKLLPSRAGEGFTGLELYYPRNGAQMLTDALSSLLTEGGARMTLDARVTGIECNNGRVASVTYETREGEEQKAGGDLFISTLPVTHLPGLFAGGLGTDAARAAGALAWRHLWLFYVAVDCERASDKIQIYFTEKKYPFKRVYEPKNLLPSMGSPGVTALCIEVCYNEGDAFDRTEEQTNFRTVKEGICEFYGLPKNKVRFLFSRRVPFSYAAYRTGYEKHLEAVAAALFPLRNFVSYGRQGSFRYNHLVDRIIDASDSVMQYVVNFEQGKEEMLKKSDAKSDFF